MRTPIKSQLAAARHFCTKVHQWPDWLLFLIVHSLVVFLPMSPFLLGTHVLAGIGLGHTYPFFALNTLSHLWEGQVFMNHLNFNAFPAFIAVGFAFNPLTYVFTALFQPITDVHWFNYFTVVVGGVCAAIWLRRMGLTRAAALVGSACYITANWWLVVTADYIPAMLLLPLTALVLQLGTERVCRAIVWQSVLIGFIWLGANTQVSFMVFSAFGAGVLALAWQQRTQGGKKVLQSLGIAALSLGIGTVIGLPKVLPVYVYGNLSWRAGGMAISAATASGLQPLTVFTYLFPYAKFPFLNFGGELLQVYVGTFGFVLLLISFWLACRKQGSTAVRWWLGAYLLVVLLAFNHSPLAALLHSVPPFSYFRGAGRWTMLASLAAAPLTAMAFDALVQGKAESIRRRLASYALWLTGSICIGLLCLQIVLWFWTDAVITLLQRYFVYFHQYLHLGRPIEYYMTFVAERIHGLVDHPIVWNPKLLAPLISLLIVTCILRDVIWQRLRYHGQWFVFLALCTSSVTLLFYDNYVLPRQVLNMPNHTAQFLQAHPGMALSIFSTVSGDEFAPGYRLTPADQVEWTLSHLTPNTNMLYGVQVLDYFDNIAARRPSALAAWVGAELAPAPDQYRLAALPGGLQAQLQAFLQRQELLSMQGVRYVISSVPLPTEQFTEVFAHSIWGGRAPVFIYENALARPQAYFADSVVTMAEDESAALQALFTGTWAGRKSLLECGQNCGTTTVDGKGSVRIVSAQPKTVVYDVATERTQWLIVTINRLPGWQVLIDNQPVASVYANGTYFGVQVPPGHHTVTLRFSVIHLCYEALKGLLHGA